MTPFPAMHTLPLQQQKLWPELVTATQRGFVLYGGTAIALYLGHRVSVDFDFFSDRDFNPHALYQSLPFLAGGAVIQAEHNTLTVLVGPEGSGGEAVKVSFFGGLSFGRVGDPVSTPDGIIAVASKMDLLGHKLKVLLQRVEAKDYLDIDALLTHGLSLETGLGAAQALFPSFAPQECLKALTYFSPIELSAIGQAARTRLAAAVAGVSAISSITRTSKRLSAGS